MSLETLPNELLLPIAKHLNSKDLNHLLQTNKFFSQLLATQLHQFANRDRPTELLLPELGNESSSCTLPALCWAVLRNHEPLVHYLVSSGVDVNLEDMTWMSEGRCYLGRTALHHAAYYGRERIVKLLIANDAKIGCIDSSGGYRPLHLAVLNGHTEVVRLLVETYKTTSTEAKTFCEGYTPLHIAVMKGSYSIVELLLRSGVDVNQREGLYNKSALSMAIHHVHAHGNERIIQLILETPQELDFRPWHHSWSPFDLSDLYEAVAKEISIPLIKLLLARGADPYCTSSDRRRYPNVFHIAVMYRNIELVQILLERDEGVDIEARDLYGYTPLLLAVISRSEDMVDLLLKNGANINAITRDGLSSLDLAVHYENGNEEMGSDRLKLLLGFENFERPCSCRRSLCVGTSRLAQISSRSLGGARKL